MRLLPLASFCLLILTGCASKSGYALTGQDSCTTNMMTVWWQLHDWTGEGDRFPPSLASLRDATNTTLFVCPNTGHQAGAMANVEEWSDYVFVGGGMEGGMCDVALLICPPENHGGHYGHVIWGCGSGRDLPVTLPADQLRALIRAPWCRPIGIRGSGFDEFVKPEIRVRIPERFRGIYGRD